MPDSSTMNYAEYALLENKSASSRGVAMVFIQSSSVMTDVKVKVEPVLKVDGMRQIGLAAGPDWTGINTALTTVKNLPMPYSEQLYFVGFKVPIPKVYLDAKNSGGPRKLFDTQVKNALAYHSLDFNYKFFNNRRIGASGDDKDIDCFNGLRYRLSSAGRSVYGIPAECKIACSADLSAGSISSANVAKFIKALSNALEIMDSPEGDGVTFYANENVLSALESSFVLTNNSLFGNDTKDALGRKVLTYRNAKIRRCGRTVPSVTGAQSQVIGLTETQNGEAITGATYTSVFGVKSGENDLLIRQFRDNDIIGPVDMEDLVTAQVGWANMFGIEQRGNRSVVQIAGITAD